MNLLKITALSVLFFLPTAHADPDIIFHDDFENQDPEWDIGDGPLINPPGQIGTWELWDVNSCADLSCGDCNTLPSHSDGYVTFIEKPNGRGGGQAIRWTLKNGCSNGYPGTLEWWAEGNEYQELYVGISIKFESGYSKTSFPAGCKVPYRIIINDDPSQRLGGNQGYNIFVQYSNGSFQTSNLTVYSPLFNSDTWWDTGISPDEIYNDHDWHWLEMRLKLNSNASASDGEVQFWIDGVEQNSKFNEVFDDSGAPKYINRIWIEQGNCTEEPWSQTDWKSLFIDDFTISTSYIGPPDDLPIDTTPPGKPTGLEVVE